MLLPQRREVPAPREDSILTRHSLLARLKNWGDDTSWRDFFETYWELIYNIARKAGLTPTEAEEVVQETIIGVAKKIEEFKTGAEHGAFKAWLLQQTRWRILDQFRKRARSGQTPDEASLKLFDYFEATPDDTATATVNRIPDPASSALDREWDTEWQQHLLRTALESVKAKTSAKQFQMFDLHAVQGLSVHQTARTLDTSIAAVYMAKSRVGRVLKRELQRLTRE